MIAARRSPLFLAILAVYLLAGGLYAFLTPPWQAPDEPAHYNYLRYLITEPDFPKLASSCYNQTYLNELTSQRFPPDLSIDNICYEFHQPPLYYLMGMPVFVLSSGWLPLLRLLSMALLGGGVVVLAFFIGRTIFPHEPAIIYGTVAFVAFVPMHLTILASINNDALAELILATLLLILSQRLIFGSHSPSPDHQRSRYFQSNLLLGIILGLGLVTKTTVYVAIPLVAVVLWWTSTRETAEQRRTRNWAGLVRQAVIIYGLALIIALPWYIRNAIIYGNFDILGLGRHDEIVDGQLRTADFLAEAGVWPYLSHFVTTTFRSFWGQFGWMAVPMDGRVYLVLTLLTLIAAGGLVEFWRRVASSHPPPPRSDLSTGQRQALGLMGLTILLTVLGYGWYNVNFVQFQGRYLFPALIPLGLFFSLGLREAFSRRWTWWLVVGLAVALVWVVVASLLKDDLNKWGVLMTGLALALATGRALLARYWLVPTAWLMTACYGVLGGLALVSPFWFIVPHLSP
jgi:4-amino-4-deoxy-L-arabinose transferase-like glycosyltransferase